MIEAETHLKVPKRGFGALVCHLHGPTERHCTDRWAEPAYNLGCAPKGPSTLRCNGEPDIEVFEVKVIVVFPNNKLVGDVSGESARSCPQAHRCPSKPRDAIA